MSEWVKVCEEKSLKDGDIFDFDFEGKQIMIAKAKNKLYALDRICTHAYADLSTGFMNEDEKTVTCPLHMSMFSLEDGSPQNLPAELPLKKYDVEVRDGWVHVMLN
jgi:3-phenylpropionate/trans-cinnamate dioxygenase ferredoxin component